MRRIFVDRIEGATHTITGEEHKHLSVVLRARIGQAVELCGGDGRVYIGEISAISRDKTVIKITDSRPDESEPLICCELFLGIIKGGHMETALQKAVELGVSAIHPLITENTVKTDLNNERAQRIAHEAAKQCGRGRVPLVSNPAKISDIYQKLKEYDAVVFPYEKAESVGLKEFLTSNINSILTSSPNESIKIAVIIGPEGGFSDAEAEELSRITTPVSLGARILRADTAAIATLAAVMYQADELRRR